MSNSRGLTAIISLALVCVCQASDQVLQQVPGETISLDICPIERIEALAKDKQPIRAFFRKPPGDGLFPAIICVHGGRAAYSDTKLRDLLLENVTYTRLLKSGFVTVAADYRSFHGKSTSRGPIWDVLAIVQAVKKLKQVDETSVVVFGGSGGGSFALDVAASTEVGAIVCGEPASLLFCGMMRDGDFEKRFEILADPHVHYTKERQQRTRLKVRRITCPVLILHGDQHPLKRLNKEILLPELKSARVRVTYKLYPNNPHGFYWGRRTSRKTIDRVLNDVLGFLDSNLRTRPVAFE